MCDLSLVQDFCKEGYGFSAYAVTWNQGSISIFGSCPDPQYTSASVWPADQRLFSCVLHDSDLVGLTLVDFRGSKFSDERLGFHYNGPGGVKDLLQKNLSAKMFGANGNDGLRGSFSDLVGYVETLSGGDGDDSILGNAGDDLLDGGYGDDSLWGGDGADVLWGGDGVDTMFGEAGEDRLYAGDDDDIMDGGTEADWLFGGRGDDVMDGGDGDDWMHGSYGFDTITGGEGNDKIYGGVHTDELYGGPGDDTYCETEKYLDVDGCAAQARVFDVVASTGGSDKIWIEQGAGVPCGTTFPANQGWNGVEEYRAAVDSHAPGNIVTFGSGSTGSTIYPECATLRSAGGLR